MLTRGFDRLLSLEDLPLTLFEHQRRAVLRVLKELRGRALLADEVGLGKTIEAGVILREYLLRGLVRRTLILVPATLVDQWAEELEHKLKLGFHRARGVGDWARHERLLASIDLAKRPEHAAEITRIPWDMVIVDEAHRLKSRHSANWQFVNSIQKKYILLLSATPVQNDLRELHNLITLLKPGQLHTFNTFRREFMLDRHSPKNLDQLRALLDDVMVRSSRRDSLVRFPRREVRSISVPMAPDEARFYETLVADLRVSYTQTPKGDRNLLPYILLLRMATSHPKAALRTLRAMSRRGSLPHITSKGVEKLDALARTIVPAKFRVIEHALRESHMHAVLFTSFKESMKQLVARLRQGTARAVIPYHAGLDAKARQHALQRFKSERGILVSTEAGSEGINLQFCHTVINYDLPWNPLRIEQRIGRVHRIGQSEVVRIYNLATEGTVEAYILYLLEKKINMFTKVVGELEAILANVEEAFEIRLAEAVLEAESSDTMRQRIEAFGTDLEEAVRVYERQRRLANTLFDFDRRGEGHE